jgi:uncharacterized protein DUF5916/cellulose/xylan binding protein with CBM9 domain
MKCSRLAAVVKRRMRALAPALLVLALPVRAAEPVPAKELPPESFYVRTAHAARRTGGPIQVDGRMDEPAWQAAPLEDHFTQVNPDEGKPASVHTAFRVLWDDEYLYFGAICDDPETPTRTLSRRDRFIEGDTVQFDLDTTLDRRTAYHFQVFAAGQQLDAIHFNDTDFTTDWDAAWESKVATTERGWSVEMKIPLRVLRIPEGATMMGFNVYRILSRRHEEDQWRYRPNGRPGDISRLGLLDGLQGIHPVRALELRPYVGLKGLRSTPAYATPRGELGSCATIGFDAQRQGGFCAGLDLRYNLASDLALVGTINPDFGQVEADQRVLNLTTFETFFPEKRPFFLEGLDLFQPALRVDVGGPYGGNAYQVFYSRRIGRGTPTLDDLNLASATHKLVYQQPSVPVLSAAKVSGTIGATSVGLLSATEPRVSAQVLESGRVDDLRTVEARHDAVARVRAPLGDSALLGVTGTSLDPLFVSPSLGLTRRHAHVGEGDLTLFTQDRSVEATVQAAGSHLTGNAWETLPDGTVRGPTASGFAGSGKIKYLGEHWFSALFGDLLTPNFSVNDLGFMPRANLARVIGYAGWRDPHPGPLWQSAQLIFAAREVRDAPFDLRLERDGIVEFWFNSNSFWFVDTGAIAQAPFVDDRELKDGTPIERQSAGAWFGFISTDPRKRLQLQFSWTEGRSWPRFERQNQLETTLVFRPLPQLDGSFDLAYNENAGTIRRVRAATIPGTDRGLDPSVATLGPRDYLLSPQHARSVSATLRATYAFTPHLTLQTYAQLFSAGISYGQILRAQVKEPFRRTVRLDELHPVDNDVSYDDRQAALNLNLILRWEWRTGSTFYLVYAHQSSADVTPSLGSRLDLGAELGTLSSAGVTHGDTILVKVDLLSAL